MTPWAQALQDYFGGPSIAPPAQKRWFATLTADHPHLTEQKLAAIIQARSRQPRETFAKPTLAELQAWVAAERTRADKGREHYERLMAEYLDLAEGMDELPGRTVEQIKGVLGEKGYADFERRRKKATEREL
jgi:hypothetical protein